MNTKTLLIVVAVVALLGLGFWWWQQQGGQQLPKIDYGQNQQESNGASDNTASLEAGLNAIQDGSVDSDFQGIDKDINSL